MRLVVFLILLLTSTFYALLRGGEPERAAAVVVIAMTLSDPFVHALTPYTSADLDPGHFIIDLVGWFALLAIALKANRIWPLWVSSLQTISLIAHVAKFLDYSIHPLAYAIMQVSSSYPLLFILGIGTYKHQKRLQQIGKDPPWKP